MTRSPDHPIVFCGTPKFAVPTLEKLVNAGVKVRLVLTQPDRPQGRGLELVSSPVKQAAEKLGLPLYQPENIKVNQELRAKLEAIHPDAIIVVGYGRIIPPWMLQLPPLGNINLHASLLPKYRGAEPLTSFRGRGLTITAIKFSSEQVAQAELLVRNGQIFVGCGNGSAIELLEVQPEGKRRMSAGDFAHGYSPQAGERLGV